MLPTTAQFDSAVDANTTEVDCIVEIEREFNTIADSITVTAADAPIDDRFDKDNVVNTRNPKKNGLAYGPMSDFFTSDDPLSAFRMITSVDFDDNRDIAYYIPQDSGTTKRVDLSIDYAQDYTMNAIEFRYENTRTSTTYYDDTINIYITPDGGSETQVWTGLMNDTGVTRIYYDGDTSWSTSKSGLVEAGTSVRTIRVEVVENTYQHHPRIMYFGGLNIVDVSDDIIDVSVNKTEFEQSAYLPIGEPSGNSCSISLDNTQKKYRFGGNESEYFMKNQKITIQFGVNIKYGGGNDAYEYVNAGTFYVEDYGYSEQNMTAEVSGQDYSKFLQETFCGNYVWVNKSLKYIVHDVLARSGITPNGVTFDFGIAGNANETNLRAFTWSNDEQTVWDFLGELAKSELGTVFYDEEENLVFTDRLDIDSKFAAGSQYSINETLNLESLDEQFVVGANKIKVKYEVLGENTTRANPQIVYINDIPSYESGPQIPLNQIIWQPDNDESYLGSATLSRTLEPNDQYIYVTSGSEIQITRDEGEVLIGDEFITYKDRTVDQDTGEGRLTIVKRDARNTVYQGNIPTHKGVFSGYNTKKFALYDSSKISWNGNANREITEDGFRQYLNTGSWRPWWSMHCTEFERDQQTYGQQYRIYGMRFRFNKIPDDRKPHQVAGLYINMDRYNNFTAFEVSSPETDGLGKPTSRGNVRAFKGDRDLDVVPMPPIPPPVEEDGATSIPADGDEGFFDLWSNDTSVVNSAQGYVETVLFEEAVEGLNEGTYINITVIQISKQNQPDNMVWYVNGNFVGRFNARYTFNFLKNQGYSDQSAYAGATNGEVGRFGLFTRGNTDVTVDYMYASNDTSIGPDELLQSRGFERYFDAGNDVWGVENDYFAERQYYVEFGAPVHEVVTYKGTHDVFPVLNPRYMNTDEESVTVFKSSSTPFTTDMVVGNTTRIGVNLNDTVYYPDGSEIDHSFLVYGVPIVDKEVDEITVSDAKSIRRYGIEEVEIDNPWVNSKDQAVALGQYIRRFWADQQEFWTARIMPNPALQVRDRVTLSYADKGFDGTDVWFVNGINLSYDGGLSATLSLRRFTTYPPTDNLDYREEGDIV